MANNNRLGCSNSKSGRSGGNRSVSNLRDVLPQTPANPILNKTPGVSSYEYIVELIRSLDLKDDGIMMSRRSREIRSDFCALVHDTNILSECMDYINEKALADSDFALKFALLFSSHNFDRLAIKDNKIRSAMLKVLEANFRNADTFRINDKDRLYNSISLLGEYYNRVRLADQTPIRILGESLLSLLIREISGLEMIDDKLAKLILSQITLNGDIMRDKHRAELTELLFHIRRNIIEQTALKSSVKALLLMTLDLYYSNFKNLGIHLEQMYTKYLVQDGEDGENNYALQPQKAASQFKEVEKSTLNIIQNESSHHLLKNGDITSESPEAIESQTPDMKWSKQVRDNKNELSLQERACSNIVKIGTGVQDRLKYRSGRDDLNVHGEKHNGGNDTSSKIARRSQRPLKNQKNLYESNADKLHQPLDQPIEINYELKPLPRWRAPRFNREGNEYNNDGPHNNQSRYIPNFKNDKSVRCEGGSIRLYSINDRLRHSQEKIERSGCNYNSIPTSNWDRHQQHDDRTNNHERGNYRRNDRNYNNREKPPRFQKQEKEKIHSDSWRRSRNSSNQCGEEKSPYRSNGPTSNSRSTSRTRTRHGKSNFNDTSDSYCRSQSPLTQGQNQQLRTYNTSYSSLTNEASSTCERKNRARNYDRRPQQYQQNGKDTQGQHKDNSWSIKNEDSECEFIVVEEKAYVCAEDRKFVEM